MLKWTTTFKQKLLRSFIQRTALKRGFIDPVSLLSTLRRFSKPSEVGEPIELLRAGVVFHARGLINSKAIQHNLDWVWPYWVEQQFNPDSNSFVPRAFSITHINLTHRNWTALGCPGRSAYPIVDPRGLVTPLYDGWSLDAWILPDDGDGLVPSRCRSAEQVLDFSDDGYRIRTDTCTNGLTLRCEAGAYLEDGEDRVRIRYAAQSDRAARFVVSLRPVNPEGISFVHRWDRSTSPDTWDVNGEPAVRFDTPPDAHHVSNYEHGDVHLQLLPGEAGADNSPTTEIACDVGMVTAAAEYRLTPGRQSEVQVTAHTGEAESTPGPSITLPDPPTLPATWTDALQPACRLTVPDPRYQFLFDAAVRSLLLLSPGDIYPGPYTYRRFWFRDAAFMIHALLALGYADLAERLMVSFPERQRHNGYFLSQEGEWDSNGETLWVLERFEALTGRRLGDDWDPVLRKGTDWILHQLTPRNAGTPHAGLMPAGFSAEHLGTNDHYYWDNFWSEAGLRSASHMFDRRGREQIATRYRERADTLHADITRSFANAPQFARNGAIPASPYRRMDSGAVGSLCGAYPLQLLPERDPRMQATVDWMHDHALVRGGFFQDMIHSGINAYLTLHLAQVQLRAGDDRFHALVDAVARLATSTGQWPEAIHPRTGGGCMGDGHHGWASAEWVMMMRNMIVREERDRLVVGGGIRPEWLDQPEPISLAGTLTSFGRVEVEVIPHNDRVDVRLNADWRHLPARVELAIPGVATATLTRDQLGPSHQWNLERV